MRDHRVLLFLLSALVLVACMAASTYMLGVKSRQGWAGLQYGPPRPLTDFDRMRAGLVYRAGPSGVLELVSGGPADRAGLRLGDSLTSVAGIPMADSMRLRALARDARPGQTVRYTYVRKGVAGTADVRLGSVGAQRSLPARFAAYLAVGLLSLAVGAFVYARRPRETRALLFYLIVLFSAIPLALFPCLDVTSTVGLQPLYHSNAVQVAALIVTVVLGIAGAAMLLHFALLFPRPRPVWRHGRAVLAWVYGTPVLAAATACAAVLPATFLKGRSPLVLAVSLAIPLATLIVSLARWVRPRESLSLRLRAFLRPGAMAVALLSVTAVLAILPRLLRVIAPELRPFRVVFGAASLLVPLLLSAAVALVFPILTLVAFVRSYQESDMEQRQQIRWPLWGIILNLALGTLLFVVGIVVSTTMGSASSTQTQWLTDSTFVPLTLLIPAGFAVGILRYRLLDLDVVIRKAATYAAVTSLMVLVYLAVVGGLGGWIVQSMGVRSHWVTVFGTLAVAAVFVPVRNRVQHLVDRRFYPTRYEATESLSRLSRAIAAAPDARGVGRAACDELALTLHARSVAVLARQPHPGGLQAIAAVGATDGWESSLRAELSSAAVSALSVERPIAARDLHADVSGIAQDTRAQWAAPVLRAGKLLGVLLVGARASEDEYDEADRGYLAAVAAQLAVGLGQEPAAVQRRELDEAREIQSRLLPERLPSLPGMRFAAHWQPAREVAGDYYDVLPLGEHQASVCVADVTGKGMPAALLMSNLQAAVKAFASVDMSPASLCGRVNRVIAGNVAPGRFISMFYAAVDSSRRSVSYTNAGHPPPLLLRHDGSCEWLTAGGLLVGVHADATFEQAEVACQPGDRLVLYTDGITEAMSASGELFGEERLLDVLRRAPAEPEAVQRELLAAVTAFCDGEFQDDATVLVVAIE